MAQEDLDPATVLELLPAKIAATKRVIQEFRLDLSVLSAVEGVAPEQIANLRKSLGVHEAILQEYERRLEAFKNAAIGSSN